MKERTRAVLLLIFILMVAFVLYGAPAPSRWYPPETMLVAGTIVLVILNGILAFLGIRSAFSNSGPKGKVSNLVWLWSMLLAAWLNGMWTLIASILLCSREMSRSTLIAGLVVLVTGLVARLIDCFVADSKYRGALTRIWHAV